MSRSPAWLPLLLIAAPAIAPSAAAGSARPVVYADTVNVSASKSRSTLATLAMSATVVGPDALRRTTARSLQDVLAQVPGLHVFDLDGSGAGGGVEGRGFAAQGTTSPMLVLVDGLPLNDPESGRVDWNVVAPSQVERLEVLRGPSSYLYGSNTLAGLVNIVTRAGSAPAGVWAEADAGDFGRAAANAGASWSAARVRGSLTGRFARGDGERDNGGHELAAGQAQFAGTPRPGWGLRAQLLGSSNRRRVPGPLPAPQWESSPATTQFPDDFRDERALDGALELTRALRPSWEWTATGEGSRRELDAFETVIPVGGLARTGRSRGLRGELRSQWTPPGPGAPSLVAGLEARAGRLESRYRARPEDGGAQVGAADVARTAGGAYALLRQPFGRGFTAVAGARLDWTRSRVDDPADGAPVSANDDQRALSPTAGLTWSRVGRASAWVSYAGAFKSPELEQLYDPRPYDLGFGPLRISNHALSPQRDDHWDAGTRARIANLWVEFAGYHARSRDELGFDLAAFRIANIARSRHLGLELSLDVPPVHGISGGLAWSWNRATFEGGEYDGNQINTVPRHEGHARLGWEPVAGTSLGVEVEGAAQQWIDEANTVRLPDHARLHVGARHARGPIELYGSVRNVTDRRVATLGYVTLDGTGQPLALYFPAAGRSFVVGLRLRRALG